LTKCRRNQTSDQPNRKKCLQNDTFHTPAIDLKKIEPRRNEEHEERKTGKSLKRLNFFSPLRALGALRGENLFLDFYKFQI
jgi:hypothetical protein